jgi:transcriptional regulator with XRE-family HTH domain
MDTNKQTKLKSYLESHGIKQTWLSKQTGITQAWINKIVNGSEPRVRDAIKIADALGVSVKELWPVEDDKA